MKVEAYKCNICGIIKLDKEELKSIVISTQNKTYILSFTDDSNTCHICNDCIIKMKFTFNNVAI